MKNILRLLFLLNLCVFNLTAQIRILDKMDMEPIAFVRIISEDGKLAATSDINGIVDTSFIAKKYKSGQYLLSISHASYETKELTIDGIRRAPILEMERRTVSLPEISIESTNKDKRIRILKGYFRSYMLEDDVPKYYTDGLCAYYITAEGKTLGVRILEHRTFRNDKLLEYEKVKNVPVTFRVKSVLDLPVGKMYSDRLGKKYTYKPTLDGSDIYRDAVKAGTIRKKSDKDGVQTSINNLVPNNLKRYSIMNVNLITIQDDCSESYRSSSLTDLRYEQLDYFTQIVRYCFSYPNETQILSTAIHEFYVYDVQFVPRTDIKGIKYDENTLRLSHAYRTPYWEELPKHAVPALSKSVSDALGKTLKPY